MPEESAGGETPTSPPSGAGRVCRVAAAPRAVHSRERFLVL